MAAIVLYYRPKNLPEAALFVAIATTLTFAYFYLGTTVFDDKTQILVACSVGGFSVLPILLVAYELAVEQTSSLGVGEGMSCGLINSLANFLGFLFVAGLTEFLKKETTQAATTSMLILFGSLILAIILIVLSLVTRSKRRKVTRK